MAGDDSPREAVEKLAEEFVERYRRGERPEISEYCARLPEQAAQIRDLFPALVMMEEIAPEETVSRAGQDMPSEEFPAGSHPERLGDYRILREVGRGGMGVVYEAEQVSLGRHVALKVLPAQFSRDSKSLGRFRREARAAAKLHHTNIVPVFEVGEAGDVRFYAMQFIQGQSLDMVLDELRRMRGGEPESATSPSGERSLAVTEITSGPHGVAARPIAPGREESATLAGALLSGSFPALAGPELMRQAQAPTPCACDELAVDERAKTIDRTVDIQADDQTQPMLNLHTASPPASGCSSVSLPGQPDLSSLSRTQPQHYYQSVARIGIQVAEALAYAHDRGVIHRDIKPSNLLLDLTGTVWVTDFGLAKGEDDGLTQTGDIVGTLRYMAVERFRGEGDARSDIYGLGATLYELATLRPAFQGNDHLKLIEQIRHTEPARPRSLDSRIPADLETVILKAIDKEPGRRYQSAAQLADDLRRFLDYRPIKARRVGWPERTWRSCRRNPIVSSLSALALALLVTIAVGMSVYSARLADQVHQLEIAEAKLVAALFEAKLNEARSLRMSRRPGTRMASLRAIREAPKERLPEGRSLDELRTEAIATMCLPDIEVEREWAGLPAGQTFVVAFDPEFQMYARGDGQGNISVRRVSEDNELFHLKVNGVVSPYDGLKFSPDGRFLYCRYEVGADRPGRCWNLAGPVPAVVFDSDCHGYAFSSTGGLCAAQFKDGSLRIYNLEAGIELRRLPCPGGHLTILWHDVTRRFVLVEHGKLKVVDDRTGEVLLSKDFAERFSSVDLAPDGRTVAITTDSLRILLIDSRTGSIVRELAGLRNQPISVLRFNHRGDRFVTRDWLGLICLWDVETGQQLLAHAGLYGMLMQFSRDDQTFAANYGNVLLGILRFNPGTAFRDLPERPVSGNVGVVGNRGRLLAIGTTTGAALIDVVANTTVTELGGNRVPLRFAEDDRELWTYGRFGCERWPIITDPDNRGELRIGPPERLLDISNEGGWGVSANGKIVAVTNHNGGAFAFHPPQKTPLPLGPQRDVRCCAVSPDGKYVATGSHNAGGEIAAKVWDATTGTLLKQFPVAGTTRVGFSPNGRWLITVGGRARLWRVGSWESGPEIAVTPGSPLFAFDPTGRFVALSDETVGVVHLVAVEDGIEIAQLTGPEPSRLNPLCFSHDGGLLFVTGAESGALHNFDLRAIRKSLRELGLDWDAPSLPQPAPATASTPLRIRVDLGGPKAGGTR